MAKRGGFPGGAMPGNMNNLMKKFAFMMSLFQASAQTVLMAFLLAFPTEVNAQKELLRFEHPLS